MQLKEYLRLFNLKENYTRSQLRQSYLKLIKQYHPDTHPGDKKTIEITQKINAGYEFLLNNLKNRPPVNNFSNPSQEQKKNNNARKSYYQKSQKEKAKTEPEKPIKSINEIYEELAEILGKDVPVPEKLKDLTLNYENKILESFSSLGIDNFEVFKSRLHIVLKNYIKEVNQVLGSSRFELKENDTLKTIKSRIHNYDLKISKIKEQIYKIISKYATEINCYPNMKKKLQRVQNETINLLLEEPEREWPLTLNSFEEYIKYSIEEEKIYQKAKESFYKNIEKENKNFNYKEYNKYNIEKEEIFNEKYDMKNNKRR